MVILICAAAPPIGLLILYGTKTLLKASALTEVYADAKKKLEFQENITARAKIGSDFQFGHWSLLIVFFFM